MKQNFDFSNYVFNVEDQKSLSVQDDRISELCGIFPPLDVMDSRSREILSQRILEHPLYPILKQQSYRYVCEAVYPFANMEQIDKTFTVEEVVSYAPIAILKHFELLLGKLDTPIEVLDSLSHWMHEKGQGEAYDTWSESVEIKHPRFLLRHQIGAWAFQKRSYILIYLSYWHESLKQDEVSAAHRYLITKFFPHMRDLPILYDMPNGAPRFGDWVEDEHINYLKEENSNN